MNKLKELVENSKNVKVRVLEKKIERNIYVRKDNLIHRVANFIVADETSSFNLIIWGDEIDKIPMKETIIINNAYVSQFGGEIFLNIGRFGSWIIADSKIAKVQMKSAVSERTMDAKYTKIDNLRASQDNLKVVGKVIEMSQIRKKKDKQNNTEHEVADFLIVDDTGCVILTLWDEWITKIMGYNIVDIENAYVSEYGGYPSGLRLSLSQKGHIEEIETEWDVFFSNDDVFPNLHVYNNLNIDNNISNRKIERQS